MDERVATLEAMLDKTTTLMAEISDADYSLPTPCVELDVEALLEHVSLWSQVFDAAVNERQIGFDPNTHRIGQNYVEIFSQAAQAIVSGLRLLGSDRPMTMTSDPMPGEFVLNMLLMEYVGHGWDLARATALEVPYTDDEATIALVAARSIIEPEHRGPGMFDHETDPGPNPVPIDELAAFLGRDPGWAAHTGNGN